MSIQAMFSAMLELFAVLLVGYCCHRWRVFPQETQTVLTRVVLFVTAPCSIVYSALVNEDIPDVGTVLRLLGLGFLCYGVLMVLSLGVTRLLRVGPGSRGAYMTMLVFSNCLFMGLPVVSALFGEQALLYLSIFSLPFYPFLYIPGVYLMMLDSRHHSESTRRRRIRPADVVNPCLIAGLVAIGLTIFRLEPPEAVIQLIDLIGGITTPASLLVIGIAIAKLPLRAILGSWRIYVVTLFRLILFPLLVWALLHPFVEDLVILGVAVVVHAMPAAAVLPMLAHEYGSNEEPVLQGVFLTTLFSMVTIPLLMVFLMR